MSETLFNFMHCF